MKEVNNVLKSVSEKCILVFLYLKKPSDEKMREDFDELENLAKSDNLIVLDKMYQIKNSIDAKFYIGSGKIDELKTLIERHGANLVIFNNSLSGSKINNISQATDCKVIDRCMLILDIFAKRAKSNEGKLQVELAQLKYSLPRLNSLVETNNRYGGGSGMRGPGETKLETDRRVVEDSILRKGKELIKLQAHRDLNRKSRCDKEKPIVAIVGYTNSGKSTLLNLITKADVFVKDELFATLDTTTRSVWLDSKKEILLTDTVGFVSDLPHEFVEAFKSTLEECVFADLLLHVIDLSNPFFKMQEQVTLDVLNKLGAKAPIIKVYNKIDKINAFNNNDNLNKNLALNKNINNDFNNNDIYNEVNNDINNSANLNRNNDINKNINNDFNNNDIYNEVNNDINNIDNLNSNNDNLNKNLALYKSINENVCENFDEVYISAKNNIGIDKLKKAILTKLF